MNIKGFDKELLDLEKKYSSLNEKYDWVSNEIESLEYEKENLESAINEIEIDIKNIKKKMLSEKIENLNIETDDKFTLDFIKASYFTAREDETRPTLQTVNIKENEIWAVDGYKAIIIKNDEIPLELQNTKILWYTRENFKEHINEVEGDFVDLKKVFPKKEEVKHSIPQLVKDTFYSKFDIKDLQNNIIELNYEELFCISFKKELLDTALMIMADQTFTMHFINSVNPIVLESNAMQMLILPTRKSSR